MIREKNAIIVFELALIILITIAISFLFFYGVRWENVQFVASLITIGILFPLIGEVRGRKINILNAKSVVLFGVVYWILLDPLTLREGIEKFDPRVILEAFLMILLFCITVYIGYLIRWPRYFVRIFHRLDYGDNLDRRKIFRVAIFSFIFGLLPIIIWGGGLKNVLWQLMHAGRWFSWGRGRWGGWKDWFITGTGYFKILAVYLSTFYVLFVRKSIPLILLTIFVLWESFMSGTRTYLGALVIPIIILYYLNALNRKKKGQYLIFVWALILLGVLQLQLIVRTIQHDVSVSEVIERHFFEIYKQKPTEYHRDDQFYYMLNYVEKVPAEIPHSGEIVVLRPLYHFIPRAIWKSKPEGITRFYEKLTSPKGWGLSTYSGSIIGDFYLCNGWLGVSIVGLLMGFLAKQFDSLIEMSRRSPAVLLVYSFGLVFMFIAIRSYQVVYENWYMFIFMYLFLRYRGRKKILYPIESKK